ncbi:MAG: DUF6335 family protein [Acidobacteriia bacterium]|nr:DUF6335 family protein [Terriglobia bacterium]
MAKIKDPAIIIDAGRAESPQVPVDEEVEEEFHEAEQRGRCNELARKLHEHTDKQPEISGGDPDAAWDQADAGDETVGGDNPTPNQDIVDELGLAAGIVYEDSEPLHTAEKLEQRDKKRWELDPASSEDYPERNLRPAQSLPRSPRRRKR